MKRWKALIILLLLSSLAQADVYVSPEEHRAYARQGLEEQLSQVPADKQVQFVEGLLAKIPQERQELELKVEAAEAAEAKGERQGPPAYFLRRGFEGIDYKEEAIKEWLAAHKGNSQARPSPSPQSSAPSASPTLAADPQSPPTASPTLAAEPSAPPAPRTAPAAAVGSTQLVALALLGAGILLGLRRALA